MTASPTVIPPLKCPKCGSSAVHVDRKKRTHCYECKAVSEPDNKPKDSK